MNTGREIPSFFPRDGEWTRDATWQESMSQCICRGDAEGGLDRMRIAVPPYRLADLTANVGGTPAHPLIYDYIWRYSRFRFVEYMVALHRFKPQRLRKRVQNRFEYVGFQAEMLAGLTISSTGATMEHEPLGRQGSIDWRATWSTGESLPIEVKCPQMSKSSRLLEWVTMNFHWALMARFNASGRVRADTGTWITIALAEDFVREAAARGIVNDAAVANRAAFEELAREAMTGIEALSWPVPDGVYSMGRAGILRVGRGAGPEPRFCFDGNEIPTDEDQEALRLRADLEEAASQLRRVPEPGLVVLDTCCDTLLRNRVGDIVEVLATESWSQTLAGVLILDRRVNGTPDCMAIFVPGECWEAALPMLKGFHWCEHGHFHAHSGVFQAPQCSGPSFL